MEEQSGIWQIKCYRFHGLLRVFVKMFLHLIRNEDTLYKIMKCIGIIYSGKTERIVSHFATRYTFI